MDKYNVAKLEVYVNRWGAYFVGGLVCLALVSLLDELETFFP
jgi:hypothetical protein